MDWRGFVQSFFDALHWSWMDGKFDRLAAFFMREDWTKSAEWQMLVGEMRQTLEQEENIYAVSGQVLPLCWMERGNGVQAIFAWRGWRHSRIGEQRKVEENNRLFAIHLEKSGDGWTIEQIREWGDEPPDPSDDTVQKNPVVQVRARGTGSYDRERAVAYAHRYWDSANPAYPRFNDDCTNFISQCLHAGGIPMLFAKEKTRGWWMRGGKAGTWSFSWSVAHSLYLLLKSGKAPMYAEQKHAAEELLPGDVICYDFNGDGRFQHNTIVVAKDEFNMPLVNAHTSNSQLRPWEYLDSTAYTPQIRYAFFHIRGM
jgi:hypothetical protein